MNAVSSLNLFIAEKLRIILNFFLPKFNGIFPHLSTLFQEISLDALVKYSSYQALNVFNKIIKRTLHLSSSPFRRQLS